MNPGLLAFTVVLTVITVAIWVRLARIILRGHWPPIGLPGRSPLAMSSPASSPSQSREPAP